MWLVRGAAAPATAAVVMYYFARSNAFCFALVDEQIPLSIHSSFERISIRPRRAATSNPMVSTLLLYANVHRTCLITHLGEQWNQLAAG